MKYIILLFLSICLYGETSFISPIEYASQLYKNPRGIGCQNWHGDYGEGKLVANYMHKGEKKEFLGPKISGLDFDSFYTALNQQKRGMPRYYLTQKEVQALFLYLQQEKKNVKK